MEREEKLPPGVYRRKDSKVLWIHYGYRGRDYRESAETNSPKKAAALRELKKAQLRMGKFVEPGCPTHDALGAVRGCGRGLPHKPLRLDRRS